MREADLYPPVREWLLARGLEVAGEYAGQGELLLCSGYCDMTAYRFAPRTTRRIPELLAVVAVELKLLKIAEVIRQAEENRHVVNESWAAMPESTVGKMRPDTLQKFNSKGIGLLSVMASGTVGIVVQATHAVRVDRPITRFQKRLWRWHLKALKEAKA